MRMTRIHYILFLRDSGRHLHLLFLFHTLVIYIYPIKLSVKAGRIRSYWLPTAKKSAILLASNATGDGERRCPHIQYTLNFTQHVHIRAAASWVSICAAQWVRSTSAYTRETARCCQIRFWLWHDLTYTANTSMSWCFCGGDGRPCATHAHAHAHTSMQNRCASWSHSRVPFA